MSKQVATYCIGKLLIAIPILEEIFKELNFRAPNLHHMHCMLLMQL